MIFSEMRQRVQDRISDSTTATQAIVDEKINETLEEIHGESANARWYYREAGFNTLAQRTGSSTTGATVSVKKGDRYVLFSANAGALPKVYIGSDFKITGDSESYRIVDTGLPGVIPNYDHAGAAVSDLWERWAILDRPYQGTTAAAGVYTVTQDIYYLRSDVFEYEWIVQADDPERTVPIPVSDMREWVPDPMNQGETGDPAYHHNLGRVSIPWINKYSGNPGAGTPTATADTTINSHVVTLNDLAADCDSGEKLYGALGKNELIQGLGFRVWASQKFYMIRKGESVAGANSMTLTLDNRYAGSTAADQDFEVGWFDAPAIQFYPVPTSSTRIVYGYFVKEPLLVAGEDSPVLPREFHSIIVDGAIWRMLDFLESTTRGDALSRYNIGLQRIKKSASLNRDRKWALKMDVGMSFRQAWNLGPNYPPVWRRR